MGKINFKSKVIKINSFKIISLPKSVSSKLSSRGLVLVNGSVNGIKFQSALEPDGQGSHWIMLDKKMKKSVKTDGIVKVELEQVKEWPDPSIPADLKSALKSDKPAEKIWKDITPLSRWDWIRWINGTKNLETRKIRIQKTLSKLKTGKRNACCFNRSECTNTEVSKNGILQTKAL